MKFDESLLTAYLDDELTPEERQLVEQHLESSPQDRETLQAICRLQEQLSALPAETFSTDVVSGVRRRIEAGAPATRAGEEGISAIVPTASRTADRPRGGRVWQVWLSLALAAGVLMMVGLVSLYRSDPVAVLEPETPPVGSQADAILGPIPGPIPGPNTEPGPPSPTMASAPLAREDSQRDAGTPEAEDPQSSYSMAADAALYGSAFADGAAAEPRPAAKRRPEPDFKAEPEARPARESIRSSEVGAAADRQPLALQSGGPAESAADAPMDERHAGGPLPRGGRQFLLSEDAGRWRWQPLAAALPPAPKAGTEKASGTDAAATARAMAADDAGVASEDVPQAFFSPDSRGLSSLPRQSFAATALEIAPRLVYRVPAGEIEGIVQWMQDRYGGSTEARASRRNRLDEAPAEVGSPEPVAVLVTASSEELARLLRLVDERIRGSQGAGTGQPQQVENEAGRTVLVPLNQGQPDRLADASSVPSPPAPLDGAGGGSGAGGMSGAAGMSGASGVANAAADRQAVILIVPDQP